MPDWQQSLLEQDLADAGFEAFCEAETDKGSVSQAYIQTDKLDEQQLLHWLRQRSGVHIISLEPCPDRDWNSTWEQEHPSFTIATPRGEVIIQPRNAFGAGYHETTSMMLKQLCAAELDGKTVLDNGCGTGVLGIVAACMGAAQVTMIDIDDQSVACTLHNCQLNGLVPNQSLQVTQADTPPLGVYDLILSNIHKNILLEQMPLYSQRLHANGQLWISGFYAQDAADLIHAAMPYGLTLYQQQQQGDWLLLQFQKQ